MSKCGVSATHEIVRPTTEEESSCTVVLAVKGLSDDNCTTRLHVSLPGSLQDPPDHKLLAQSVQVCIDRLIRLSKYLNDNGKFLPRTYPLPKSD